MERINATKERRSEEFKEFLENVGSSKYATPLDVPPEIFMDPGWLTMRSPEYFARFSTFLEWQVRRAATHTRVYPPAVAKRLAHFRLETRDDWFAITPLPKDAATGGLVGLRSRVEQDPRVTLPDDIESSAVTPYDSGGSQGVPIPTWITPWDRKVESGAMALLFHEAGIEPGSTVFWCYNTGGHKGGWEGVEALEKLACEVHVPKSQLTPAVILQRAARARMSGRSTVLFAVPMPRETDRQNKGGGRTLRHFVEADARGMREAFDLVCLGGDRMTDPTLEWLASPFAVSTSAVYGATEVLPLLWTTPFPDSNGAACTRNDMHLFFGPNFGEVLRLEEDVFVPARRGERGLVAVTSLFRQGTPYVRLLIGDGATVGPECLAHGGPLWQAIERESVPADVITACAGD